LEYFLRFLSKLAAVTAQQVPGNTQIARMIIKKLIRDKRSKLGDTFFR
jgi:hypothetical protein